MIPDERLQQLMGRKDPGEALEWCVNYLYSEGWAIVDGALVIYDLSNPPEWFPKDRDEDGNSRKQPA